MPQIRVSCPSIGNLREPLKRSPDGGSRLDGQPPIPLSGAATRMSPTNSKSAANETEKGFGTGLRAQLERKRGPVAPAPVPEPVEMLDPDAEAGIDALRSELEASLAREEDLRSALAEQLEAYERGLDAEQESAVRAADLDHRAEKLARAEAEIEQREQRLAEREAAFGAEENRLERLAVELAEQEETTRAKLRELKQGDRDREQAAAELAEQTRAVADREKRSRGPRRS